MECPVSYFSRWCDYHFRTILELDAVQAALSLATPQQLPLIGFCSCQTLIYLFTAVVIAHSSATALNLSLLSADGLTLLGYFYILDETFGVSSEVSGSRT